MLDRRQARATPPTNCSTSARSSPTSKSSPTSTPAASSELRTRGRAAAQGRARRRAAPQAEQLLLQGPPGPALRRAAVLHAGRDHPRAVRVRRASISIRRDNPSEAERMAIVATGGYGRGLLAPGSDIDLLFLLPYKQTAWGESVAEAILYCLWDIGPEGRPRHALGRRMHPPGQGGHDDPHRAPGSALPARRPASCSTS